MLCTNTVVLYNLHYIPFIIFISPVIFICYTTNYLVIEHVYELYNVFGNMLYNTVCTLCFILYKKGPERVCITQNKCYITHPDLLDACHGTKLIKKHLSQSVFQCTSY